MELEDLGVDGQQALQQVLGYLNFSAGTPDPQFLAALNGLYAIVGQQRAAESRRGDPGKKPAHAAASEPTWRRVGRALQEGLARLRADTPAFRDADQAAAVLELLVEHVVPAYREFHRDLLFHQDDEFLLGPFLLGRVCEAVLRQGPPWTELERICSGAIRSLNDYIGHRPVATLESQKIEPYPHEWVRPIPLYIEGAGVAVGRCHEVIERALELLRATDETLLHAACLDPQLLEELALDPRAYDFDHPVNKRPNYHFGQWDPHHIDNRGRYRRFVVQQVTLDALLERTADEVGPEQRDELLVEAAAVLAGTMLMAAGISGRGPDTYDSDTTLTSLLPVIAAYRDAFYEQLLSRIEGPHGERLRQEAKERKQPFGGARQHLNAQLARRRAIQVERVQLAKVFARMGHPDAARRQVDNVRVPAARMACRIDCHLTAGHQAVASGDLSGAADLMDEIMQLLQRAIGCGAMVDPWNILGFDANFSLFPALENSVHDHRVDELILLMDQVFALFARIWSAAAAADDMPLSERVSDRFHETALWWNQYAAHEVSLLDAPSGLDAYHAARNVAKALNLWHKGGAASGDVGFWAPHAEMFDSAKAYSLVIEELLERRDFVAAMGLLVHWMGQAERVPLQRGDSSFHSLSLLWLRELLGIHSGGRPAAGVGARSQPNDAEAWMLVRKLLDYLEANAERYWQVPEFHLVSGQPSHDTIDQPASGEDESDEEEDGDQEDLFSAAYENVVYRDSTDDGVDGQIFEPDELSQDELEYEAQRIVSRLAFLDGLARLWRTAALALARQRPRRRSDGPDEDELVQTLQQWVRQAAANRRGLAELLQSVNRYRLPRPSGDPASMVQYDRHRLMKESLLEHVIAASVETADTERLLQAAIACRTGMGSLPAEHPTEEPTEEDQVAIELFCCGLRGDVEPARRVWPQLIEVLKHQPILYVPLSKSGDPRGIVAARFRQRTIQNLLLWLPRMGMLTETCELIETAREMEREVPVGPGAVTEFDELFEIGYRSLVESLVRAAQAEGQAAGQADAETEADSTESDLVSCLEQLTESLLVSWLAHSRTLRLSVLEKVNSKSSWQQLVEFIERYGGDLFTQRFLNLGNVRAILHQGVDAWLTQLQEEGSGEDRWRLLDDLEGSLPREKAVETLTLVLEAIVENYGEYRDYNSSTTQSDQGELLFTLLDFLRLRSAYERVVWNLKPVVLSHEILVRRNHNEAAQLWRRALSERIGDEAERFLKRLATLQKKYAMRMPTVADRLSERFLRPLIIDRMKALVDPAIRQTAQPGTNQAFELLEEEAGLLMQVPSGAGLDVPTWLLALEDEVERVREGMTDQDEQAELDVVLPTTTLQLSEVQRQLDDWGQIQIGESDEAEDHAD